MITTRFEHRTAPLLGRARFIARLAWTATKAIGLMAGALGVGIVGYRVLEGMSWIDALLEASMILGGMGPIHPLATNAGKLFASFYALFSGVVFLSMSAVLVAPVLHRLLHQMHLDKE